MHSKNTHNKISTRFLITSTKLSNLSFQKLKTSEINIKSFWKHWQNFETNITQRNKTGNRCNYASLYLRRQNTSPGVAKLFEAIFRIHRKSQVS